MFYFCHRTTLPILRRVCTHVICRRGTIESKESENSRRLYFLLHESFDEIEESPHALQSQNSTIEKLAKSETFDSLLELQRV